MATTFLTLVHNFSILYHNILVEKGYTTSVVVLDYVQAYNLLPGELNHGQSLYLTMLLPIVNDLSVASFPAVPWRLCEPCYIVVCDVTETLKGEVDSPSWSPLFQPYPRHHVFYFFTADMLATAKDPFKGRFAKSARKLLNVYMVSGGQSRQLALYQPKSNGRGIVHIGSIQHGNFQWSVQRRPNYDRSKLIMIKCFFCPKHNELYEETGKWFSFPAALVYEFFQAINASVEHKELPPRLVNVSSDHADFVDRTAPLLNGSVALNMEVRPTPLTLTAIYLSSPFWYDRLRFMTRRPRRVSHGEHLRTLLLPLKSEVWVSVLSSVILLLAVLAFYARFSRNQRDNRCAYLGKGSFSLTTLIWCRSIRRTVPVVLKPSIDQGGVNIEDFVHKSWPLRLLLGVWLLTTVILSSTYRSKLVEFMTLPHYELVPSTFRDLAESKYGVYMSTLRREYKRDFKAHETRLKLQNGLSQIIVLVDDVQCYKKVLEGDNACIGFGQGLGHAITKLADVHGRSLYVIHRASAFLETFSFGLSKHHVMAYDTLKRVVDSSWTFGLIPHWLKNEEQLEIEIGRKYARNHVRLNKTQAWNDASTDYSVVLMAINLIGIGFATALLTLLVECLTTITTARIDR